MGLNLIGPATFEKVVVIIPWAKIYKAEINRLINQGHTINEIVQILKKKYNK